MNGAEGLVIILATIGGIFAIGWFVNELIEAYRR